MTVSTTSIYLKESFSAVMSKLRNAAYNIKLRLFLNISGIKLPKSEPIAVDIPKDK